MDGWCSDINAHIRPTGIVHTLRVSIMQCTKPASSHDGVLPQELMLFAIAVAAVAVAVTLIAAVLPMEVAHAAVIIGHGVCL